jgi:hypothetical protein
MANSTYTLAILKADTLFLANTVTSQYSDTDIERNINMAYDDVVSTIWNSVSDWQFDEGVDYLPIAYTNLVDGQDNYQLPTNAREIERVEIKHNDSWVRLDSIDHNAYDVIEEERTGTPKYFDLVGRSIMLYPTPDYDETSGLMIKMTKSVTQLSDSDDTPKIDREFVPLISLKAALKWCIAKGKSNKRTELEREIVKMENKLKGFYSQRNKDYDTKITPVRYNYE